MTGNSDADYLGNPVSGADAGARDAVNGFVAGFIGYEARAAQVVKNAARRPDHGLLNLYAAVLFMLLESPEGPKRARPFLDRALATELNERERRTAAFLTAWIAGDIPKAMTLGEAIVGDWPRDLAMVKLCQYLAFNGGDAARMLRIGLTALPEAEDVPQMHGMVAFGYEECHQLAEAERAARRALDMRGREPWAQHALAHVMLTEGRIDEGARFLEEAAAGWDGLNSFMATHNWWHLCLFYLSQGRGEAVLRAFDDHCWAGDKDYSQDQVGAVSLLARAELAGIDVGDRWGEVAERIAARGLDTEQPFLTLQYLYALIRARRAEAPALLAAIRRRAASAPAFARPAWIEAALPAAEGIAAALAGDASAAIRELGQALPRLGAIGGSHAQRDLFEQTWLGALIADGRWGEAKQCLEARRAFDPDGAPLNRMLARACDALDLPAEAAAARARAAARLEASGRNAP